jgi:CBS domain-containing protein
VATVQQLLLTKEPSLWSIAPDALVYDAIRLMAEKEIGALLVLEGGKLVGVMSERDYARKVILKGKSSRETRVRDIMTPEPKCVTPDDTVERCMNIMTDERIRHLPVTQDGRLVGIISIGDVVKAIITQQEFFIEQLRQYIAGG